jgi:hypothetical protein
VIFSSDFYNNSYADVGSRVEHSDASCSEDERPSSQLASHSGRRFTETEGIQVVPKADHLVGPSDIRPKIGPRMLRRLERNMAKLLRTHAKEIWLALPINPKYLEKGFANHMCGQLAQNRQGDRVSQFCVVSALFSGSYP